MTLRLLLTSLLGTAALAAAPASVWDNPVFQKRLLGSFGFSSEVEPPMSENERSDYEQILPLLKDAPDQALVYLEKLRALPDSSARFDFLIGNLHFQNNRKPQAAADFLKALEKFPDYRQAHANLAILYAQAGRHKEAVRHFSEAIRLGAADSTQYGLLGISHLELENFTAAEEAFRLALVLGPDVKDWKTGLVRALYLQERFTEAVALLEAMIRETPEDDSLWSLQASAQLGRKDMLAAAANFEVLDRLGKLEAAQLSTLGDIYVNEGLLEAAAGAYLRAHEKTGGGDIGVPLRAAEVLLAKQGYQAARQMLQKLGEGEGKISPADRLRVLKLEARIGMAEGREAEAAELLVRVAEQDPLDGETLLLLGGFQAGSPASVVSLNGDVSLTALGGSVVNADYAGLRLDNSGDRLDPRLQRLVDQGLVTADQVRHMLSPALMAFLYPHAPIPGEAPVAPRSGLNIQGAAVTVVAAGAGSDIGRASEPVTIGNPGQFDQLSASERALLSQARPSDVRDVRYAVYRYKGNDATVDLARASTYANTVLWERVVQPDTGLLDLAAASDDGLVDLRKGDLVASKFEIEQVQIQVWDEVRIAATGRVDLRSQGDMVVEVDGDVRVAALSAADRLRLQASGSILGEAGSVTHLSARDIALRAGDSAGLSAAAPLRLALTGVGGRIQASAGDDLSLDLREGEARIGVLKAGDTLTLRTRDVLSGAIVDQRNLLDGHAPNFEARSLVLRATGSIGGFNDSALDSRVASLQVRTEGAAALRNVIAIDNLGDLSHAGLGL